MIEDFSTIAAAGQDGVLGTADDHRLVRGPDGVAGKLAVRRRHVRRRHVRRRQADLTPDDVQPWARAVGL